MRKGVRNNLQWRGKRVLCPPVGARDRTSAGYLGTVAGCWRGQKLMKHCSMRCELKGSRGGSLRNFAQPARGCPHEGNVQCRPRQKAIRGRMTKAQGMTKDQIPSCSHFYGDGSVGFCCQSRSVGFRRITSLIWSRVGRGGRVATLQGSSEPFWGMLPVSVGYGRLNALIIAFRRIKSDKSPIQGLSFWPFGTQGGAVLCPWLRNVGPLGLRYADYKAGRAGRAALRGLAAVWRILRRLDRRLKSLTEGQTSFSFYCYFSKV